ncbi:MAG: FimV/HubP family polar landmark protein [Lautropia sp.]|nr:FimV/HubP family polar landmark protein [Lautropia sp.]
MTSGGSGRGQTAAAVAVALAIMSGVGVSSAEAAGLGRLTVQSALGQPLRAEVEVTAVAPDEADSLTARLASPDAFRQAGLQYKEALAGVKMAVEKRDGRYVVKLSSNRPINEPFVDLMLELSWGSGNFTREYTFLLDPPVQRNASQQSRSAAAPVAGAAVGGGAAAPQANGAVRTIDPATGRLVSQDRNNQSARQPAAPAPAAEASAQGGQQPGTVVVGKGETLGVIAARVRPASATLEQTIVAIYRNNPAAFIQNNPHLIRQGRTLNIPSEGEIAAIDSNEAGRQLRLAARDFRSYKERLAAGVVDLGTGGGSTTASGTVTAPADEGRGADAQKTDRLELSRSDVTTDGQGRAVGARDAEAQVAREAALKEANSRIAELEKNVGALKSMLELKDKSLAELQKQLDKARAAGAAVSGSVAPAATAAAEKAAAEKLAAEQAAVEKLNAQKAAAEQAAAAEKAALEKVQAEKQAAENAARKAEAEAKAAADKAAADQLAAARTDAEKAAADTARAVADKAEAVKDEAAQAADDAKVAAEKAAADAKAEVAKVTDNKPMPAPASVNEVEEQGNVLDNITQNPLLLPGLGAFAVVAGLGYWMLRRRRREEDAFSDSLGADEFTANSLFGTTGGQSVDTMTGGTSTQITTISESTPTEVDPIAEAEVYIAYGRETQAEEILREALKRQPERQAIRLKLLEIYAGRKDTVAFGQMAREMHEMTGGLNEEWPRVVAMGASLDPENPLYGEAQSTEAQAHQAQGPGDQGVAAGMAAAGMVAVAAAGLSQEEAPAAQAPEQTDAPAAAEDNSIDFGAGIEQSLASLDQPTTEAAAPQTFQATRSGPLSAMPGVELPSLDLDSPLEMENGPDTLTDLNVDTTITESLSMTDEPAGNADLEAIGLDLSPSTISGPVTMSGAASSQWQEMASKLDLASAYTEIGDKDGARELLEEVLNGGDATQQQRARELLADL